MGKQWLLKSIGIEFSNVGLSDMDLHRGDVPTLYHVSFSRNLPKALIPRLPYGTTKDSPNVWHSEPDIPRVSFSSDLVGAVRGIFANIVESLDLSRDLTIQVYKVSRNNRHVRLINPEVLVNSGAVHDAVLTNEWWALDKVSIEHVGTRTVRINTKGEWLKYKPFGTIEEREHSPIDIKVF